MGRSPQKAEAFGAFDDTDDDVTQARWVVTKLIGEL